MREFKLIIAGGRDFTDAALLERVMLSMQDTEFADVSVSILSGMARGADALGYAFAKAHNVKCYEFPADWETNGRAAGYIRNGEMANFADGLLAFWNGSNETGSMIAQMKNRNKPVTVINY